MDCGRLRAWKRQPPQLPPFDGIELACGDLPLQAVMHFRAGEEG
jgi:hypothetical protein